MPVVEAYEIAKDVFLIDTNHLSIPHFNAVYLIRGDKLALMEAGDHTSANVVLAGIQQLGFHPQDVAYIFCSHIHLDHSGAAGILVGHMPQAQVVVHERGAKHIVDPSRLVGSYGSLGGDPRNLTLVKPVPISQVTAVKGGETFSLGKDKTVQVIATPGHSPHSVCYLYSQHKGLFAGDSVGVYIGEEKALLPVAAPGYDHEQALASLEIMSKLPLEALFLPHYGMFKNVGEVIQLAQKKWREMGELAEKVIKSGDSARLDEKLRAWTRQELKPVEKHKALYDYMTGDIVSLSVQGFTTYHQRRESRA